MIRLCLLQVLIPQLTLSAVLKKSRHALRQANIQGIVDFANWLIQRSEDRDDRLYSRVKADGIAVVGHSAGGAVAFEAACIMQRTGMRPRALLLLDGVPWVSTINRARASELSYVASKDLVLDGSVCNVCSLRAKRAPVNANGLFFPTMAESSKSFVDIEFPAAKHADFADGAWKSCFFRLIGMATTEQMYGKPIFCCYASFNYTLVDDIMRVCYAFLANVLELKGEVQISGLQVDDVAKLYASVLENPQSFTLQQVDSETVEPINTKKLPLYLQ